MWKKTNEVQEREKLVRDWLTGDWTMPALSKRYGVSEKTGWKWVSRFNDEGWSGLEDRSRARKTQGARVAERMEQQIIQLRRRHPDWGAVTIRSKLIRLRRRNVPAASTIGQVLKRNGLVTPRTKRSKTPPYTQPLAHAREPNDVWCIDFKGWFRTRDGRRCDPLTVTDARSRYLLLCRAVRDIEGSEVKAWLERAFAEYGLPKAIRSDNGTPFGSTGLCGLSELAVWLVRLGITPERIQPGRPDQNGRHERFHKTLKQACCNPPAGNRRAQQRAFNRFQHEYIFERPHSSLGGLYPADVYRGSPLVLPAKLPEIRHPDGAVVRRVRTTGDIKWRGHFVFVSKTLRGQTIALVPEDTRYWTLHFGSLILGTLDDAIPAVLK